MHSASGRTRARGAAITLLVPLMTLGIGLAAGAVVLFVAGRSPLDAYGAVIRGGFGSAQGFATTLTRSIPLILAGVGIGFAVRAGYFNLGAEGQMVLGALASATVASALPDMPAWILLPLVIAVAIVVGGIVAAVPAWWQAQFGMPLLVTTLLLNYVINLFASYLVTFPLRDLSGAGALSQTPLIPQSINLPVLIAGTPLHAGLAVALLVPLGVYWFQRRTVLGFETRITGLNPVFARYGGIDMVRTTVRTMFISGAICGLAGVIEVLGSYHRYLDGMVSTPGTAWTAFAGALLAGAAPLPTVVAALFLGGLGVGGLTLQREAGIPLQLVGVVQAVMLLMVGIRMTIDRFVRDRAGGR